MLTGALSPSGARSAGQDAIAEASEAQDARMARFSGSVRDGCVTTSFGCSKTVPGWRSALKVENVVVAGGRRPHGILHSMTSGATARTADRRAR